MAKVMKTVADLLGSVVLPMQCETNERKAICVCLSSLDVDVNIRYVSISITDIHQQKVSNFVVMIVDTVKPSDCNFGEFVDGCCM
ncbi:hypothetical protein A8C40_01055 [Ligilactobacillus salivarius]|nr:hypothetical protein A8C40_01055 [Ligilactobacillus salivarius]